MSGCGDTVILQAFQYTMSSETWFLGFLKKTKQNKTVGISGNLR